VVYNYLSPWSEEYRTRALQGRLPLADPATVRPLPAESALIALRKRLERGVLQRSRRAILMTESMADICCDLHGLSREKIVVIPGGVDTDRFRPLPDRRSVRRALGLQENETLIFTVRNLVPRMGLGNLIEAMQSVLRSLPRGVCIIGGDGPLKAALCDRAEELRLGDRVRFAGFIPEADLPGYYGAADLFVLPTAALEGFGLVTVEALACGTPVVGTPVGGTPEILRGLDPALILQGAEPNAIAAGILTALDRVVGHEEWRARCRDYAVANYSWQVVVDRVEAVLLDVAKGAPTPV
jgi:glycosyltransferase involved in cell wall biosynthesis